VGATTAKAAHEPRFEWPFLFFRESMVPVVAQPNMRILEKTARFAALAFAVLFISLSLFGIVGAWFVSRTASDGALKAFGIIEIGVGVVDTGIGRVDDLVATSRA